MTAPDPARQRLHNQRISAAPLKQPGDVVAWLGAVQAQDYLGALWAIGLRTSDPTETAVEQALAEGAILRTHLMRPTWHLVSPADIRWILALTAPRTHAVNAYYYRKLELDDALFARANAALVQALQGGQQLIRAELATVLQQAGIATDDLRFSYIMMHAELDGVVCSGARRGKQITYALLDERAPATRTLLDERAPATRTLARDEALAELTRRYYTSHGPATVQDFVWWSGLTSADATRGLNMLRSELAQTVVDGQVYWFAPSQPESPAGSPVAYLLPNYDEYMVGYTDRSAALGELTARTDNPRDNLVFSNTIVIDGRIVGTWKRTLLQHSVVVELDCLLPLTDAQNEAIAVAAERYAAFLGRPVALS